MRYVFLIGSIALFIALACSNCSKEKLEATSSQPQHICTAEDGSFPLRSMTMQIHNTTRTEMDVRGMRIPGSQEMKITVQLEIIGISQNNVPVVELKVTALEMHLENQFMQTHCSWEKGQDQMQSSNTGLGGEGICSLLSELTGAIMYAPMDEFETNLSSESNFINGFSQAFVDSIAAMGLNSDFQGPDGGLPGTSQTSTPGPTQQTSFSGDLFNPKEMLHLFDNPQQCMRVDSSWHDTTEVEQGLPLRVFQTHTFRGYNPEGTHLLVDIEGISESTGGGALSNTGLPDIHLTGNSSGYELLDPETGMPTSRKVNNEMSGSIKMLGMTVSMYLDSEESATITYTTFE